jgi:hypothetical protein
MWAGGATTCRVRSGTLVLGLKSLHLMFSVNNNIHQVIEVIKLGGRELVLQFLREAVIKPLPLLSIGGHFVGCILRESVEGIDIRHYIPMTLSEIEEFLFLDVHDTLGDVEGVKCCPKLLPCEAVIRRLRGLPIPPPSPRGIMKLVSGE